MLFVRLTLSSVQHLGKYPVLILRALTQSRLGFLTAPAAGMGTVIGTFATGRRTYRYDWQTCPTCHGHKIAA